MSPKYTSCFLGRRSAGGGRRLRTDSPFVNRCLTSVQLGLLAALLAGGAPAAGPQSPVFRGGTSAVVVELLARTNGGAEVNDLTIEDLTLKVDGRIRPISSFEFQRIEERSRLLAGTATRLDGDIPVAASYVLLVVDPATMRPEPSRILLDQLAKAVPALPNDHAVGLIVVPSRTPQVRLGGLRQSVAQSLRRELGSFSGHTYSEAQVAATRAGIEAGIAALSDVSGRRTLVYLGDFLREDHGTELMVRDIATLANAAGVSISVIASDAFVIPGPSQRNAPAPPRPGGEFGHLPLLTDLTGGEFYRRAVPGALVVPRLVRDLSAQYVLAFDTMSGDLDGRTHRIELSTRRKGVQLSYRREFAKGQ